MSRDEDFSDIPELGPADEDRLHKSIPTLQPSQTVNPSQETKVNSSQSAATHAPVPKKSVSPLMWILVLLLAAGLGFSLYQQMSLQKQLRFSEDALLQTQSRLADIESLVNATDESTSKTGAAFLAQLKRQQADREARIAHVDSEIRKLWAIYQKYKPAIEDLEKGVKAQQQQLVAAKQLIDGQKQQIDKQQKSLDGQQKELTTVGKSLDSIGVSLDSVGATVEKQGKTVTALTNSTEQVKTQLNKDVTALKETLRLQNLEQQETNDIQGAEIADLKAKLSQAGASKAIEAKLNDHQKALDSINASRRQINAEILKLRNQLGSLQSAP